MTSTEILELVLRWLPAAFFVDLFVFTGAVWVQKVRA